MKPVNKSEKDRVIIFDTTLRDGEQCPGATMTFEEKLEIADVTRARNQIDDVEWSAEDGTRSEMDYLCRIVEAVIKAGATTVNIPDTVGYTVPEEYTHFMRTLIERVPNSDKAVFSVHCHNDLGMAVANSLAGIAGGAGADQRPRQRLGRRAGQSPRPGDVVG